jgi:hypothetical protein
MQVLSLSVACSCKARHNMTWFKVGWFCHLDQIGGVYYVLVKIAIIRVTPMGVIYYGHYLLLRVRLVITHYSMQWLLFE